MNGNTNFPRSGIHLKFVWVIHHRFFALFIQGRDRSFTLWGAEYFWFCLNLKRCPRKNLFAHFGKIPTFHICPLPPHWVNDWFLRFSNFYQIYSGDMNSKRVKRDFSGKIWKCHFRRIRKPQLCAKNQKIPMNGFWDLWVTDGCEFRGSARYRREPKMDSAPSNY